MSRKIIAALCAVLLLALPFAGALAESVTAEDTEAVVNIIYCPTNKEKSDVVHAARHVANAIAERWSSAKVRVFSTKNIQEQKPTEDFINAISTDDSVDIQKGKLLGWETLEKDPRPQEIWMIMTADCAESLTETTDIYGQISTAMQENAQARLHLVFIRASGSKAGTESELYKKLSAAYPERVAAVQVCRNFMQADAQDAQTHSGDWFVASLYGETPAALPLEEKEAGTYCFTMPKDGTALVLAWQNKETKRADVHVEEQLPVGAAQSSAVQVESFGKANGWNGTRAEYLNGAKLTNLSGQSTYVLTLPAGDIESVKVFYYPEMAEAACSLSLGANTWERWEQEISLSVTGGDMSNCVAEPAVNYAADDGKWQPLTVKQADGEWKAFITPQRNQTSVRVKASVAIKDANGNLLRKLETEEERAIVNTAIEALEQPDPITLYFYQAEDGRLLGRAALFLSDYFALNPADGVQLFVDGTDAKEWQAEGAKTIATGTDLTVLSDGWQCELAATSAQGEDLTVTLKAKVGDDEGECTVQVQRCDVGALVRSFEIAVLDENNRKADKLLAGHSYTLKVTYPEAVVETWASMPEDELTAGIPRLEKLLLCVAEQGAALSTTHASATDLPIVQAGKDGTFDSMPAVSFTGQKDGTYAAEVTVQVDRDWKTGELPVQFAVFSDEEGTTKLAEKTDAFAVINDPPTAKAVKKTEFTVKLAGMADENGQYQANGLKVEEALGVHAIGDLFEDPETTDALKYTVQVDNLNGVTLQQDGKQLQLAEGETSFPLENGFLCLNFTTKGDRTLILRASDGVNDAASLCITVHVKSALEEILLYIGLGVAALLLAALIAAVIHQVRKPAFGKTGLVCVSCASAAVDSSESMEKLLAAREAVPMEAFGKKKVPLSQLLICSRQAPLPPDEAWLAEDIFVAPGRNGSIRILFGGKAKKQLRRRNEKVSESSRASFVVGGNDIVVINRKMEGAWSDE